MGLLERIEARTVDRKTEQRYSADQWISDYLVPANNQFLHGGHSYPLGLTGTWATVRQQEIANSLPGYLAALRSCPPAFAAQMVRAMVLSQARFVFRNRPTSPTPRRTFGTRELGVLERPWPNATTGQMLARMEWHAGLAGNAYVVRQPDRLRVLRPDWVAILYGSDLEPDDPTHAIDGHVIGYVYQNGGIGAGVGKPRTLLPGDVSHWCADEETEILTADGWKDFRALNAGDEVLTLNHETGLSEWQPVIEKLVFPAQSREMVSMEGGEFSSLTTPNHRWPTEYRISRAKTYGRRWVTSATIGAGDRIPVAAYSADVPTGQKWTDALVEVVAWFWTEGRFKCGSRPGTKGRGIDIAQAVKNADNVARIRAALTILFGPAVDRMSKRGPRVDQVPVWRERVEARPEGDMVIFSLSANAADTVTAHVPGKVVTTDFIRSLTASQLDLFIKVSLLADNNGPTRLAQKDRPMAEQFALACILAGYAVSIRDGCEKKRGYRMTNVRMLRKRHVYPQEGGREGRQFRVRRVMYDGHVWCPRTENQTWMARRRGSVYFTGNSPMPDPERAEIGMSWLTPALRDIQADRAATEHTVRYFAHGATPNLVVKGIPAVSPEQFAQIVDMMEERHAGVANAYRTLYLTAGADATVVGSNLSEINLTGVQSASETRVTYLSRVPATLLGIAAGLEGSGLNAGNFAQARRTFSDSWVYPSLQDLAAALAVLVKVPSDAELWFDVSDIPLLREDARDAAEIEQVKAATISSYVTQGFTRKSAIAAVAGQDVTLLREDPDWISVQLQAAAGKTGQPVPAKAAPPTTKVGPS